MYISNYVHVKIIENKIQDYKEKKIKPARAKEGGMIV